MADQNFRVKNGIGIGTYSFVDINRNVNAGVTTLSHLKVSGITTVGIISAIDGNGAQGIVTFQSRIGIHSNGKQITISSPSVGAGYTDSYELVLPPVPGTDGQSLVIGQNGQLGFTTAGLYEARFYVSSSNGDDTNDGRAKPVATIKKAAQLASFRSFSLPGGRFLDAGNLLELNRSFIQNETISYLEFNYPNITTDKPGYNRSTCIRDIGLIVDAISYDLSYGGNTKAVAAGLSYWNAGVSYVSGEEEETLFAYNYVAFLSQYIINNQTPPTLYQTVVAQEFDFTIIQDSENVNGNYFHRRKDARNLIVANRQEIIDKSLASVAIAHSDFYFPGEPQTNLRSRYYDSYRLIQQNRQTIINYAYAGISTNYPGFVNPNPAKCQRDLGIFIDSVSTDVFTGGNNYSREFVIKYFSGVGIGSLAGEEQQTIYAFRYAGTLMKEAITNLLPIKDLTITADPATGSNTSASSCSDVRSNIDSLVGIVTTTIGAGSTAGITTANLGYFAGITTSCNVYCAGVGIGSTNIIGGRKCARDLGLIVDAIAQDISYGSNQHIVYSTKRYFNGVGAALTTGLLGEENQSITAFQSARDYCKKAITNQLNVRDFTIQADAVTGFNTDPASCANIQTNIDNIVGILTVAIGNSSLSSVPAPGIGTITDCANVRSALVTSVGIITSIIGIGTTAAPAVTLPSTKSRPIAIIVEAGEYVEDNPIILYEDVAVLGDNLRNTIVRPSNAGKDLFRVRNGCYVTGFAMKDNVDAAGIPQFGFDYAVSFDDPADPQTSRAGYAVKTTKPTITRSPYIQNCSILSFLGANGILVDGNKVLSPNTAIIPQEAEIPLAGAQPEFGKSMVAAAFTMVSFGGIGWRCINDGYAQVVSCFQIFCKYGSITQSGGYLSITNSATNFGYYALRSLGWSPNSFIFDRGRIAATGTSGGLQTLKVVGLGRSDQDLYVLRFYNNAGVDQTPSFKPVVTQATFNATSGISTSSDTFLIPAHPFTNGDTVLYLGDEGAVPPKVIGGLVSGNQYYLSYSDVNSFKLYEDSTLTQLVDLTSGVVGIHTLQKGNLEFFVKDILNTHTSYQVLGIGSTANPLNFVSGRQISQPVTGGTAVGYAVTYRPNVGQNGQLLVSVEASGGVRRFFAPTGSTSLTHGILDHSGSPVSVAVTSVTGISTYHTIEFKIDSTPEGTAVTNIANLPETYNLFFHRPSIINSSSHTWEYSGSGIDYNALPQNGGRTNVATEQIFELGGRVYSSGTNELGDFKIGSFITAFNRTGNIVFKNEVSIGVLSSLRLSLSGGIEVEEFSTDVGLGDNEIGGAKNARVSTQLAVRTFLSNRLGNFIDKSVSTNAIPSSIVQLNATGQINADLIPPKVVNYYRANVSGGRTDLVNQIPATNLQNGDTVIEPGNGFVLISDVYSQYLILSSNTRNYNYNNADTVVSATSNGGAIGIVTTPPSNAVGYGTTGLVKGVLLAVNVSNGGSGYNSPGIYTCFLDASTGIGTSARASITVGGGGTVTSVNINFGGRRYVAGNVLTVNNDALIGGRTGGAQFQATVTTIETRLYLKLTNNQKFTGSVSLPDYISDNDAVAISTLTNVGYAKTFDPRDTSVGGSIDFTNDRIIVGLSTFTDADHVIYSANDGNLVGGLSEENTYYIKRVGITSVELYTTYALSNKVDLTSSGTLVSTLTRVGVNTGVNLITFEKHGLGVGDAVNVSGSTPSGITTNGYYYVGVAVTNAFSLHEIRTDSLASVNGLILNPVSIANTNGGTFTVLKQNVTYTSVVNTSSNITDNWTVLASGTIDASNITSGTVSPSRLGNGSATDDTFLAGDSSFKKVVTSVGIGTTQPLQATASSFDTAPGGIGINTYYGKVNLTVNRAAGTGDLYSTLGVAKFKTSTFSVDADGAVSIKSSAQGDVDSATLGGQAGAYYLDPTNFTGNIPISKGGTGLGAAPSLGAILQGNGLTYDLVTAPTFGGNVTITNSGRLSAIGIAVTNILVAGVTGIATFQNFKVTNEVISGVSTFSGSGNNINQTAGTAALNRLTVTGVTSVSTLFFESLGGTAGATIPYIQNVNTVHTGIVTFSSTENNIQQTAGTAELNNLTVAGVSTFVSIVNFGVANFGTVDVTGTLSQLNGTVSGVSTFSGSGNNIKQTDGTAALNRLTVAGVSTVARLEQSSNETSSLQRLTVAGISTFTGQLNAGTISASSLIGTLNNTLTISSPLTGTSYNNSGAVTLGINATSANTNNYVVQRGASGEFSSGTITSSGQLITTQANNTATGGGQIYLNGATGNRIDFNGNGVAAPTFATRSVGTKIVLYPVLGASAADYGFGIESSTLWSSVPTASDQFKWYAGITNIATLSGAGALSVSSTVTGTQLISNVATGTAPLTVASTTLVSNLNAQYLNGLVTTSFLRRDIADSLTAKVSLTDNAYFSGSPTYGFRFNSSNDANNNVIMYDDGKVYVRSKLLVGSTSQGYAAANLGYNLGTIGSTTQSYLSVARSGQTLDTQGLIVGLDTTNAYFYLRDALPIVFGTGDTTRMTLNNSAELTVNANIRTPIFYDSGNTGYYIDPASQSRFSTLDFGTASYYIGAGSWGMRNTTPHGYIEFGPANTSHAHIYTDRSNFYFNVNTLYANGNVIWHQANDGSGSGLDADLLDGLDLHTGRNDNANKVVRTDGNGYIQAGWINSTSGDSGFENRLTRITCSYDNYLRYLGLTDFKVSISLSGKNNYSRRVDYSSNANYHVGSFGHSGYGANETYHGGSGFFDIWSGTNYPGGLTHIHGFNALHYTTSSLGSTGGDSYGWQMAVQYNSDSGPWWRRCNNGGFSGWLRLVSYGNNLSGDIYAERFYDHNNTGYYGDFASTSNFNALTVNSTFTVNNAWSYVANNYGYGIVGLYTSTVFQLVFAMGDAYKTTAGGGISNLYGIAWSHPNAGGIAGNLNTHGALITENGSFLAALSGSVRSRDDMRTPIYYDNNNTGYYLDPNSTTSIRTVGSWRSDSSTWDGEFSGKIQYHSNNWYFQYSGSFLFRNSGGSNVVEGDASGNLWAYASSRSPIFYDYNNTAYYTDPAGYSQFSSGEFNSYIRAARLTFIGEGGNSGQGVNAYSIFQEGGGWTYPYPDLRIAFHTGIKLGGNASSYEGTRVYSDYDMSDLCIQLAGLGNYSYKYKWMKTNDTGFFSDSYGAHIYPNSGGSYTQWRIDGSKNSYGGIYDSHSAVNIGMYDGSGNGGVYREANGRWIFYHLISNNCMGVNTSTTSSSYGLYVEKGIYSTGNVVAYSDARRKTNIKTIDNAVEKVLQLRGVTYNKLDVENNVLEKIETGVIAQEVESIFPEVVTYAEDIDEYGVSYGNFAGLFIEAFKEQNELINMLRKEVEELKFKLGD